MGTTAHSHRRFLVGWVVVGALALAGVVAFLPGPVEGPRVPWDRQVAEFWAGHGDELRSARRFVERLATLDLPAAHDRDRWEARAALWVAAGSRTEKLLEPLTKNPGPSGSPGPAGPLATELARWHEANQILNQAFLAAGFPTRTEDDGSTVCVGPVPILAPRLTTSSMILVRLTGEDPLAEALTW